MHGRVAINTVIVIRQSAGALDAVIDRWTDYSRDGIGSIAPTMERLALAYTISYRAWIFICADMLEILSIHGGRSYAKGAFGIQHINIQGISIIANR